jgi:hypothetical protein
LAVKFVAPADTGSNKPEKFGVKLTSHAYWHKRPTGYLVSVLKPKVDRLSVTLAVDDQSVRAAIRVHLAQLSEGENSGIVPWKKAHDWGSQKYDRSYALILESAGTILVQCAPPMSNVSTLRFEFNPNASALPE